MHAFPPRVHDAAFLEINPLGTLPALFDGEAALAQGVSPESAMTVGRASA